MNPRHSNLRNDDRKDEPPYSRIFVVCSKNLTEEDLRTPFEKFGEIEDLHILRDRQSGDSRGVAYIKYNKTSSAAAAVQKMHMGHINNEDKRLKVMIASNRDNKQDINEEKYNRLFIKVSKHATVEDIRQDFSQFSGLDYISIQKNRVTNESNGFAYVNFNTFLSAAIAFEKCDPKYKPVFATPKDELKRSRNSFDNLMDNSFPNNPYTSDRDLSMLENYGSICKHSNNMKINLPSTGQTEGYKMMAVPHGLQLPLKSPQMLQTEDYKMIVALCIPQIPLNFIERLFNIVPGMKQCQYSIDTHNNTSRAVITYENEAQATYAVEKLDNFKLPSGEVLAVKPYKNDLTNAANELSSVVNNFKNSLDSGSPDLLQLANAIAQASALIKQAACTKSNEMSNRPDNVCSVKLPPPQPLASSETTVAQRCFIVCKPQPPPQVVLQDVFCRFGDLIEVSTFPGKTFGFVKYASVKAAQEAMKTLHGATLNGIKLKVLEASDKPSKNDIVDDFENEDMTDRKRKRIEKF